MVSQAMLSESVTQSQRILLVEDNYLVAQSLRRALEDMGFEVVGPAPSVSTGEQLARENCLNGAILDINILGGDSSTIAQVLAERGCPFIFITGYASPQMLPQEFAHHRRLHKPVDYHQLEHIIREQFAHPQ